MDFVHCFSYDLDSTDHFRFNSSGFLLLFIGAYQLLCWLCFYHYRLWVRPKHWNYFRLIFFSLSNYRSAFWLKFNKIKDVFTLYFVTDFISWTKSLAHWLIRWNINVVIWWAIEEIKSSFKVSYRFLYCFYILKKFLETNWKNKDN